MEGKDTNIKSDIDPTSLLNDLAQERTMNNITDNVTIEPTIDTEKDIDYAALQNDLAQERTEMAQERTDMAESRTTMARKRTNMAQVRTDMAFERTALSNSQTLLAYIRTAIAAFAAGIGMFEFVSHPVIIKIGIVFMAVAPVILVAGFVHYFIVRKKMGEWQRKDSE